MRKTECQETELGMHFHKKVQSVIAQQQQRVIHGIKVVHYKHLGQNCVEQTTQKQRYIDEYRHLYCHHYITIVTQTWGLAIY